MSEKINSMKYIFNRNGEWIDAGEKELWCWEAYYNDGTFLKQFGDDGIFHQFKEIDQSKLAHFKMVSDDFPPFTVIFNPKKMKLIHFYKKTRLNIGSENETFFTMYCFGWEAKVLGRTVKMLAVVTPSGEVILTENPDLIDIQ